VIRRLALVASATFVFATAFAQPANAHGIGGRLDLPIPVSYFIAAAGLVVVASFMALAVLWPEPRLQEGPMGREVGFETRPISLVLRVVGVIGLLLVVGQIVPPLFGVDRVVGRSTIAPVTVWVLMWLVVPFGSASIGNWYRDLNPWTTVTRWMGLGEHEQPDRGSGLGVWPAAALLIAFTWLELVSPDSGTPTTLGWCTRFC
jgi:hypothetical protein